MEVFVETVGPLAENSYFVADTSSGEAIAIDPGDESERLLEVVRTKRWKLTRILVTHAHIDHVGAVAALREASGAPFYMHAGEQPLLDLLPAQAQVFGLTPPSVPEVDGHLAEGEAFRFGDGIEVKVLETPGHSPASLTFHIGDALFSGDCLFAGGIGRTDLPGGDLSTLMASIRERLLCFPDATVVYPGHGPVTTIGEERRSNPFLLGSG